MTEQWKPVRGYEGVYEVSNRGRVRSTARTIVVPKGRWGRAVTRTLRATVLSPQNQNGYQLVFLSTKGRVIANYVHRLVADAFLGPCPRGAQVNHKDRDRANNAVPNLEYVTPYENNRHAGLARLTEQQAREIYRMKGKARNRDLATRFRVSRATISNIWHKRTWKRIHDA